MKICRLSEEEIDQRLLLDRRKTPLAFCRNFESESDLEGSQLIFSKLPGRSRWPRFGQSRCNFLKLKIKDRPLHVPAVSRSRCSASGVRCSTFDIWNSFTELETSNIEHRTPNIKRKGLTRSWSRFMRKKSKEGFPFLFHWPNVNSRGISRPSICITTDLS